MKNSLSQVCLGPRPLLASQCITTLMLCVQAYGMALGRLVSRISSNACYPWRPAGMPGPAAAASLAVHQDLTRGS